MYKVEVSIYSTEPRDHHWTCRYLHIYRFCDGALTFSKEFTTYEEAMLGRAFMIEMASRAHDVVIKHSQIFHSAEKKEV